MPCGLQQLAGLQAGSRALCAWGYQPLAGVGSAAAGAVERGSAAAAPRGGTTHPRVGLQPPPSGKGRENRRLPSPASAAEFIRLLRGIKLMKNRKNFNHPNWERKNTAERVGGVQTVGCGIARITSNQWGKARQSESTPPSDLLPGREFATHVFG